MNEEELARQSLIYTNETIQYARDNPHVKEGMLVRVYDDFGFAQVCYGIIVAKSMRWSEYFLQYIVDVDIGNRVIMRNILAGRLEREMNFRPGRIKC